MSSLTLMGPPLLLSRMPSTNCPMCDWWRKWSIRLQRCYLNILRVATPLNTIRFPRISQASIHPMLSSTSTWVCVVCWEFLSADGTATPPIINTGGEVADINQVVFTRGGTRYPLEYNLDTSQKNDTALSQQDFVDSQLTRNYLNAIRTFSNLNRSGVSSRGTWLSDHSGANQTLADLKAVENKNCYGVGIAYDNISGDGVDFSQLNWGLQMDLGLTSNRPHACYVFVHSKNTLVFNSSGLQIIQ